MTRTAQAKRRSLTTEPLLLRTERLHRVDASQLPEGAGVALGHCRTDMGLCFGDPDCSDQTCTSHPGKNGLSAEAEADALTDKPQRAASDEKVIRWLVVCYFVALVAFVTAAVQATRA